MKKLTLNLDELTVESFEAADKSRDGRGTVLGAEAYFLTADCVTVSCGNSTVRPCFDFD